jgi:hypothetical protein
MRCARTIGAEAGGRQALIVANRNPVMLIALNKGETSENKTDVKAAQLRGLF